MGKAAKKLLFGALLALPGALYAAVLVACQTPKATMMSNLSTYLEWLPASVIPEFITNPSFDRNAVVAATVLLFVYVLGLLYYFFQRHRRRPSVLASTMSLESPKPARPQSIGVDLENSRFSDQGSIIHAEIGIRGRNSDVNTDRTVIEDGSGFSSFRGPTGELASLTPSELRMRAHQLVETMRSSFWSGQDMVAQNLLLAQAVSFTGEILSRYGSQGAAPSEDSDVHLGSLVVRHKRLAGVQPLIYAAAFLEHIAEKMPG